MHANFITGSYKDWDWKNQWEEGWHAMKLAMPHEIHKILPLIDQNKQEFVLIELLKRYDLSSLSDKLSDYEEMFFSPTFEKELAREFTKKTKCDSSKDRDGASRQWLAHKIREISLILKSLKNPDIQLWENVLDKFIDERKILSKNFEFAGSFYQLYSSLFLNNEPLNNKWKDLLIKTGSSLDLILFANEGKIEEENWNYLVIQNILDNQNEKWKRGTLNPDVGHFLFSVPAFFDSFSLDNLKKFSEAIAPYLFSTFGYDNNSILYTIKTDPTYPKFFFPKWVDVLKLGAGVKTESKVKDFVFSADIGRIAELTKHEKTKEFGMMVGEEKLNQIFLDTPDLYLTNVSIWLKNVQGKTSVNIKDGITKYLDFINKNSGDTEHKIAGFLSALTRYTETEDCEALFSSIRTLNHEQKSTLSALSYFFEDNMIFSKYTSEFKEPGSRFPSKIGIFEKIAFALLGKESLEKCKIVRSFDFPFDSGSFFAVKGNFNEISNISFDETLEIPMDNSL